MKTNRRSLKIKGGPSVVDTKLKGRVEKAQSFAKAVLFSLFLLVAIGLYVRWDSLMALKHESDQSMSTAEVNTVVVDIPKPSLRGEDKEAQFANELLNFKEQLQDQPKDTSGPSVLDIKIKDVVISNQAQPLKQQPILSELGKMRSTHLQSDVQQSPPNKISSDRVSQSAATEKTMVRHASPVVSEAAPSPGELVVLLSGSATVTASVRGNLGPPQVVVSPAVKTDWLKDRWQAAKDMTGAPLPGPHWLQLTLPRPAATLSRVLIDFEVALCTDYSIEVFCPASAAGSWETVHDTRTAKASHTRSKRVSKMHILHDITVREGAAAGCKSFDKIRLNLRKPATRFGTSVWRLEAYGLPFS